MKFISKRMTITERNFKMIDIGSVIIHESTLYDIYSIKGDSWSNLVIAGIARTSNQRSRILCFTPHCENIVLLNTNFFTSIKKLFIPDLINLLNIEQMFKDRHRYRRA